jgi:superfamily II DNA or RNA helicase
MLLDPLPLPLGPDERPSGASVTLRPYQLEALDAVRAAGPAARSGVLVVLPTGTGKTVLFSALVAKESAGRRAVLVHRDELVQQTLAKLEEHGVGGVGVVAAERNDVAAPVVVASVQTLARPHRLTSLLDAGDRFGLVVVDEAHHAAATTWRRVLDTFAGHSGPAIVGFTATPERADGKSIEAVFRGGIVYRRGIAEMILEGYLSDVRGLGVHVPGLDLAKVERRGALGDYDDESLGDALLAAHAPGIVAAAWKEHAQGRRTVVYAPTVAAAKAMAEALSVAGARSDVVHGALPVDQRRRILQAFKDGELDVVSNCAVLTEGVDVPSIECVVVARPTRSRSLYIQMVGRGLRKSPGKHDCLVLDLYPEGREDESAWTLSRLSGLTPTALSKGLRAGIDTVIRQPRALGDVTLPPSDLDGSMIAEIQKVIEVRDLAVLAAASMDWIQVQGGFRLSLPGLSIDLRRSGTTWEVVDRRDGVERVAVTDLSLELAQGVAEDIVRQAKLDRVAQKDAPWRQMPPSEKQLDLLKRLGWRQELPKSRGEASRLITELSAKRSTGEDGPATSKQIWWLRSHGVAVPPGLTRRQASRLIGRHKQAVDTGR